MRYITYKPRLQPTSRLWTKCNSRELSVLLINLGDQVFQIAHGDRIAQMIVAPVTRITWDEVARLDETDRGSGGYGSTGTGAPR